MANRMSPVEGSSPHTRGARSSMAYCILRSGIIPAYAGSTRLWRPCRRRRGDHPRIRGEHRKYQQDKAWRSGSSPHTRGARSGVYRYRRPERIIPAYAGSTAASRRSASKTADHPRIRGEHDLMSSILDRLHGSSPHTRGAPRDRRHRAPHGRIIPAYAGSTVALIFKFPLHPDHPRIRGEHTPHPSLPSQTTGSSPHTRGALHAPGAAIAQWRIIPAYAGSTRSWAIVLLTLADHPRIRGEHELVVVGHDEPQGSSPHTRGALSFPRRPPALDGIIPAYAGSTRKAWSASSVRRDHPRIRGEHDRGRPAGAGGAGSSPHTRGARWSRGGVRMPLRIIPAYAGSTTPPTKSP